MACTLEIGGINGEALDGSGLPTRLVVYARRHGSCDQVEITVRLGQLGPALFTAVVAPDQNGTASATFHVEPPVFACGFPLWVDARCAAGGACTAGASVSIACKTIPGTGPGGGPGGGPGDGSGSGNWPWPLPPSLFCPLIGRAFTLVLLLGIVTVLTGIATANVAVVGAGVAISAGAFGILAVWRQWCALPFCYYWGAVLWVLKRCLVAGLVLTVVFVSFGCLLATLAVGIASGIVTNRMRKAHCPLPSIRTPLTQLPLW